jgi:hypothetical protein
MGLASCVWFTLRIITLHEAQSTNGANGNALATVLATGPTYRLIPKGGDHSPEAPVGKTNGSLAQFFLAYPNAPATEHTFVGVVSEKRAAGIHG